MKALVQTYRDLLVADESIDSVEQSLHLVERIVDARIKYEPGEFELAQLHTAQKRQTERYAQLSESIQEYEYPELQRATERRRKSATRTARQSLIMRTAFCLGVLPSIVQDTLEDDRYSLFVDSCLVVFHHAYFALLPELRGRAWERERDALLTSFRLLAESATRASDRYYIQAMYFDAMGDGRRAAQNYRQSVLATSSDAHEFMTTLQSCWGFLVERRFLGSAIDLLLENYARVPRQDLDEMKELILATFQLQRQYYEEQLAS